MVLGRQTILDRLETGDIFRKGTWDEGALKEASYALRVAPDGLMLNGKYYRPGYGYPKDYIEIKPGKIAILSTVERLNKPCDLVGKIGIRLDYALKGITGLMGIQVDPLYGRDKKDERLFVRVANLGNEPVKILPGAQMFTFELHEVTGSVEGPTSGKPDTWERILEELADQDDSSWTYVTRVSSDLSESETTIRENFDREIEKIRDYLQPVVLFGVFLIAATILSVAIATILSIGGTSQNVIPSWVINVSWILLMVAICLVAIVTTAVIGIVAVSRLTSLFSRSKD